MMIEGTYTKLKDGEWGVRLTGNLTGVEKGDEFTIIVTKRSGETKAEEVKVLWIGADRFNEGGTCGLAKINRIVPEQNDPMNRALDRQSARNRGEDVPRKRGRLVGKHTNEHCSCGNWSGVGSPCLYSYGEAKDEGEARYIEWERVS